MAAITGMIPALILGAGQSTRMGRPKLALPWEETTVLGHILDTFSTAGAAPLVVVTGSHRDAVIDAAAGRDVSFVHNVDFLRGDMLRSIQIGLHALLEGSYQACLLAPGDLPAIKAQTVRDVIEAGSGLESLVVPSYKMRRGHPVMLGRVFWEELLSMNEGSSLRTFLNRHQERIQYVLVEDEGMFFDLDTPEDYAALKP